MLLSFAFSSCGGGENLTVIKKIENTIEGYDTAIVHAINDTFKSSDGFRIGSNEISVEALISESLKNIGIKEVFDEKDSDLKAECHFYTGWGLPRLRRHFKISLTYITFINIKFIDVPSNKIIGEIEYKKPFFQTSQKDIINILITGLVQSYQLDANSQLK